jgi:HK97 family phage prohead protease
MEADFSGYATKAGLLCSDGKTIMPGAFKHQDSATVPLVWQHGHSDPENVLGHAVLENRNDGVYAYCFLNDSPKAKHTGTLVKHKDITMMSIWANDLIMRSKSVLHGAIREVSLVLSGANPGALIDNITIRHADDDVVLEDEAIIYTGLEIELEHAADDSDDDETVQDVYDSMTPKQKEVLHYMVGEALVSAGSDLSQSGIETDDEDDAKEILDSFSPKQKALVHNMLGQAFALKNKKNNSVVDDTNNDDTKGNSVKHNVFENDKKLGEPTKVVLSHSDIEGIVADATKMGSFKEAVEAYALSHGIEDIDILFPDAKAISTTPELFGRRTEWVNTLMNAVRKSPFARIKTLSADITVQEARAKGYIKGTLKKEEFFKVAKRVTTPTTIYKKQKLDRDDMIDITDFDVVTWLKGEMRLMLDEELARAVLVGDGRAADDEDKIDEERIRPIATDHELYTTVININIDDASSSFSEVVDAIALNRSALRGTGLPIMFTTEYYIGRAMTQRDSLGRRLYRSLDELAAESRVSSIVAVEILEEYSDIVAVLVNPVDYVLGADRGGNISMFDDFDIDYNQYKYLIETRCSGALTKLKSAMVVKKVAGSATLVVPAAPTFDGSEITIVNQTGVVYRNADTDAVMNAAGSPYAVAEDVTVTVNAEPASGYYFASSDNDSWSFTGE